MICPVEHQKVREPEPERLLLLKRFAELKETIRLNGNTADLSGLVFRTCMRIPRGTNVRAWARRSSQKGREVISQFTIRSVSCHYPRRRSALPLVD